MQIHLQSIVVTKLKILVRHQNDIWPQQEIFVPERIAYRL